MISTQDKVDAVNVLERLQQLLETTTEVVATDAKTEEKNNIIISQIFAHTYASLVEILEWVEQLKEELTDSVGEDLGLHLPLDVEEEEED